MEYEAVRLFVERAQAATSDFAVTDVNVQAVAEICIRLDGLPLAIELAAPRVRALPAPALLRRLDQRLRLLTGGAQDVDERQRTLRATLEWSYDLLLDSEKVVFAELGTFIGGCRLEAAEAVCDPRGELGLELLGRLESLVEKSLLLQRADPDGEPRFWMLETIREFAMELLAESSSFADARARHAAYFRSLAENIDVESRTGDQAVLFGQLDAEREHRTALEAGAEGKDAELLLGLAPPLQLGRRGYVAGGEKRPRGRVGSVASDQHVLLGLCTMLRSLAAVRTRFSMTPKRPSRPASNSATTTAPRKPEPARPRRLRLLPDGGERAWRQALSYAERGGYAAEKAESVAWLDDQRDLRWAAAADRNRACKRFHEDAGDDTTIRAWCQVERSVLEAMQGALDLARELLADGTRAPESSV
jgi:hypothetical protein